MMNLYWYFNTYFYHYIFRNKSFTPVYLPDKLEDGTIVMGAQSKRQFNNNKNKPLHVLTFNRNPSMNSFKMNTGMFLSSSVNNIFAFYFYFLRFSRPSMPKVIRCYGIYNRRTQVVRARE